jgi:hypothetical protein
MIVRLSDARTIPESFSGAFGLPVALFPVLAVLAFALAGCGSSSTPAKVQVATLAVTTTSLPNGQIGVAYSASLAATGGTTPYRWSLISGTFPTGLSLNASTGAITGTPTVTASATPLTIRVDDSGSPDQFRPVNLTLTIISPALAVTTTSLPDGRVGTPYSASLAATGGIAPYTWTLASGALPAGLSLNASTGVIAGMPTASGNATPLTFNVTDSGSPMQRQAASVTLTIAAPLLAVATMSLPNGQVSVVYTASLAATGGTPPYNWSLIAGTLPAGLSLNAATGAIAGTPTDTADAAALTFNVVDSSVPAQNQPLTLALNVSPALITVSVSPGRAGLTTMQVISLTPTTNDFAGVNWSINGPTCSGTSCGTFSSGSSLSAAPVTFTAPSVAGLYTVTATSTTEASKSASVPIGVTDLSGVTTYHNDNFRDGANTQEYALTSSTVTSTTFGKLFSCTVDGAIYAQPLWIPNLTIASAQHNVVFVATQHDSIYAFDADTNTPCTPLWHANLLDSVHGATSGESSVPSSNPGSLVGAGHDDIAPEVGITSTPVIDLTTDTLYVVSKSVIPSGPTFFQRIHAIDLFTGNEKFNGPVAIAATFPGTGDGGTTTTFVPREENQRSGLALVNGVIYIAWASHEDFPPFYGWVIGYDAADLSQASVLNVDPNAGEGGIWMSGGAPAADSSSNIYLLTSNGLFDATSITPPTNDYGDSFLKMDTALNVLQYFTPSNQASDQLNDRDFGSGGAAVLIDLPANGVNPTHLVVGGGKDGALYILNRDSLGGSGDANAWQRISSGSNGIFATGAFWNSTFYLAGVQGKLEALTLNPATAKLNVTPASVSTMPYLFPGATPSVSASGNTNGIVWTLDESQYCTKHAPGCGPVVLHADDATNLASELWNSTQGTGNDAGYPVKFAVPTVANGKVYIGTRGNNAGGADSSTTIPGELDVYGLLPN